MSKHKHNYTQYSNKPKNMVSEVKMESASKSTPEVMTLPHNDPVSTKAVDTNELHETVAGMVVGCAKLNVRSEPSLFADIVCTLDVMSEIAINVEKSDKDWFYVCTAIGIEGYCMRKYVEAHL